MRRLGLCQDASVARELWEGFVTDLHAAYLARSAADRVCFFRDTAPFREFAASVPPAERVSLLVLAYERLREIDASGDFDGDRHFWASAYHVLVACLMAARLKPTPAEACVILGVAFPRSGYGYTPLQPIAIAERAFRFRPYAADLFDSALAYRETLQPLETVDGRKARQALDLLLWHDVRRPARTCYTNRIQRALAAMSPPEAAAWQMLLRHGSPRMWKSGIAKDWPEEARARLAALGEACFLHRLERWFHFAPRERLRLGKPGSHYFRLLVLYAGLVERSRAQPVLDRLSTVEWSGREPMRRVTEGLARLLHPPAPDG